MTSRVTRECQFVPRVINPHKMVRAVFFAADSRIRDSRKTLEEKMAWLRTEVLHDPQAAPAPSSEKPSVFLFDDTGLALLDVEQVRAKNKNAILVLLSYQPFIQCAPPQAAHAKYPYAAGADLVFAVDRHELLPE